MPPHRKAPFRPLLLKQVPRRPLQRPCNGRPLDFVALLEASSDGDLAHDVSGIRAHLDRAKGRLQHCFLPRYSLRAPQGEAMR